MVTWLEALLVALAATIFIIIVISFLIRLRLRSKLQNNVSIVDNNAVEEPKAEYWFQTSNKRLSYHMFRRGSSVKPIFNWADHPSLIIDAVENGWSRFAFTNYTTSSSVRSSMFGSTRATGDHNNTTNNYNVDLSWEVGPGSVDFMQKLRFTKINGSQNATSTVRMALPLPGPPCSFPQEAYFEIMILSTSEDNDGKLNDEGEKIKLIDQNNRLSYKNKIEEGKMEIKHRGKGEIPRISVGMGGTECWTVNKNPGRYQGSIGFNSNGSVLLNGIKLVFEDDEKEDWSQKGKVIGCGFDPRTRKVFFTVDSKLVRVIYCKSEDFRMPLYPILTVNTNISVLVNMGQTNFVYSPANAHRSPNPCFMGPIVNSSINGLGYEDSRELFSGRIDGEWLSHNGTVKSTISNSSNPTIDKNNGRVLEGDDDLEGDLFEIALMEQGHQT